MVSAIHLVLIKDTESSHFNHQTKWFTTFLFCIWSSKHRVTPTPPAPPWRLHLLSETQPYTLWKTRVIKVSDRQTATGTRHLWPLSGGLSAAAVGGQIGDKRQTIEKCHGQGNGDEKKTKEDWEIKSDSTKWFPSIYHKSGLVMCSHVCSQQRL